MVLKRDPCGNAQIIPIKKAHFINALLRTIRKIINFGD
jgi:hypothetical protein